MSAGNEQKTPLQRSLNIIGEQAALDAIATLGKALPATVVAVTGSIVKVKFNLQSTPWNLPEITMPAAMYEYGRVPIQVDDAGAVIPSDASLGGISGLGQGAPTLALTGNLSSLLWIPVSRSSWPDPLDPNAYELWGPAGVILRNGASTCKIVLNDNGITITLPTGKPLIINGDTLLNGNLGISGDITAPDGSVYAGDLKTAGNVVAHEGAGPVGLATHTHTQPNDSHGDLEGPTSAPTPGT